MVNRFYRRTPYDIGLYTPPVDVIRETMQIAQKNYDTNYALSESIKNNFIPSLPQDRAEANRIQTEWSSQIDEIVGSYNGDYSRAGKKLASLLSSIRKEYGPGGKAGAIMGNYATYNQWLEYNRKRLEEGKVLAEDLNLANNYYMRTYTGVGEMDPTTGNYNRFNPENLQDYKDYNQIIDDINKDIPLEEKKIGTTKTNQNGYDIYTEEEVKGKDPNKLYQSFASGLSSNPQYTGYLQQRAKFLGATPEQTLSWMDILAKQKSQELGGYWFTSHIDKAEANAFAVASHKAGLDKQNMMDVMGSFLQYGSAISSGQKFAPTIDKDDWQGDFEQQIKEPGGWPISLGLFPDKEAGIRQTAAREKTRLAPISQSLDSFLQTTENDKKLVSKNVIPDFARALWEDHKRNLGSEFSQKYGKDPKYTKQVEKNFWYDYDRQWKNQTAYQSYSFAIPEQAKQNALRLLPAALSGQVATYTPGKPGQQAGVDDSIAKSMQTKEGKLNYDMVTVNYVQPSPGYEAAGFEIQTPKGSFVIVDPDYQRSQWSNMLASGLNPIFQMGKSKGAGAVPYGTTPDGSGVYTGVPHVKWEKDPSGNWNQNLYMHERSGQPILQNGQPVIVTLPQIMEASLPFFANSLGYGQTKAAAMPFSYFQGIRQ